MNCCKFDHRTEGFFIVEAVHFRASMDNPSTLNLCLNNHSHVTMFAPGDLGTMDQILFLIRSLYLSCIALYQSGSFNACLYVVGTRVRVVVVRDIRDFWMKNANFGANVHEVVVRGLWWLDRSEARWV